MSGITTHVLDTARGQPARGIVVTLERCDADGRWSNVGTQATDEDGRARTLVPVGVRVVPGRYRLRFETGAYFAALDIIPFFPTVTIDFAVVDGAHHHVPLLLSPYGYSTYRGS